jgi:hypothetical protein
MGYTDIVLECLRNIYIIQGTEVTLSKLWIFPPALYICYGLPNLNFVFRFHNSYIEIAELCTVHNEQNYVQIM